jgi:esterase/lipase
MSSKWTAFWILFGLIASACAPAPTPVPATATLSPAPAKKAPERVTFTTFDDATLEGILYGTGETAVIFSVMGNCKRGWEELAELVGQYNMMALTYQWRGCREDGSVDNGQIQKFVDDLRGAVKFISNQGAKKIILVGASLGGVASAKLAVETQASGLIVIASPPEISQWGFVVEASDMNTKIPKLFITSENDDTVAADKTRELFDLAAEPKEWQTYPGTAHGTDLFETESKKALQERILEFLLSVSSMIPPN